MRLDGDTVKVPISCTITTQGQILMILTEAETAALVDGTYFYDVATDALRLRIVEKGTIEVTSIDQLTPLEGTFDMEIPYTQRTDKRLNFDWTDSDGSLIAVASARLQAKSAAGVLSLDLKWFATVPSEATISALPAIERGYLAPKTGHSLEMHISDTNTIAAGTYTFDLQAQDGAGDWDTIATGTIAVKASITNRSL